MITPKFFALSLLLVSSCALARVQINAHLKLDRTFPKQTLTRTTQVQLNVHEERFFNDDELSIGMELISEQENEAQVTYEIFEKNAAGEYVAIAAPVVCVAYGQPATVAIGNTDGDSLCVTLNAEKI
jgi:hypothetical protein